jgi:ketosteroid isomerase-like protein
MRGRFFGAGAAFAASRNVDLKMTTAFSERNQKLSKRSPATMRRVFFISLLAVTFVGLANGQETAANPADIEQIKAEVLKVEDEGTQAVARGDIATLDRIYSDELSFSARGELLTKAQVLDNIRSGRFDNKVPQHSGIKVHVFGDTVVLTGYSTSTVHYKGKETHGPRWFTNVYVKQDGQWRLVVHSVVE